jgi:hypothetical protein
LIKDRCAAQERERLETDQAVVRLREDPLLRRLKEAEGKLVGFDGSAYSQARERLSTRAHVANLKQNLADRQTDVHPRRRAEDSSNHRVG